MSFRPPFWSPSQAEAIIFDWDGVIAETRLDFSGLREKYYGGRRAMLLEDAASLPPSLREALMLDLEEIELRGALSADPVPGVTDVIEWTRENKIPWAVVSRNCKKSILKAAEVISIDLPEIVRSRDDGDCVKPDPRALSETCRELGADPAQTLLIGDFIYDMIGARRAGMRGALVRENIETGWEEWLEYSCRSMNEFLDGLISKVEIAPWEYQKTARKYGKDLLAKTAKITALTPTGPNARADRWLAAFAPFGVGTFAVPDVQFSPEDWRKNPSFDPACMGSSLLDAVRSFLRTRFPLARAVPAVAGGYDDFPSDPDRAEDFILFLATRDD
ncbi:MAG: HAD-IA family hydrolase [Synergistaceae bacterium]|jgi:HAD superfamily hydrolase (TIGR01549 family)|nr:HAD-IA family hydrolase [Synergistaceae bacterium]